jgi:DNA-binding NtrC family response regulator
MTPENARFLLINGSTDPYWVDLLTQALQPLGTLQVGVEQDMAALLRDAAYDLVIIDTSRVEKATRLIKRIHAEQPGARIVLMTASPTWARAREAFLAGAIDYTRKSLDPDEIRTVVQSALNKPQSLCQPE